MSQNDIFIGKVKLQEEIMENYFLEHQHQHQHEHQQYNHAFGFLKQSAFLLIIFCLKAWLFL